MAVYFAQAGADGPVKIGFSQAMMGRLRELQVGCPERLTLIRELPDATRADEHYFHLRFKDHRVRGEWFRFHPDMLTAMPASSPPHVRDKIITAGVSFALREARCRAGVLQKDLAAILNISAPYLCDLEAGRKEFREEMAARLPPAIRPPVVEALIAIQEAAITRLMLAQD